MAPLDAYTAQLAERDNHPFLDRPHRVRPFPSDVRFISERYDHSPHETRAWREVLKGRRDAGASGRRVPGRAPWSRTKGRSRPWTDYRTVDEATRVQGVVGGLFALLDDFSEDAPRRQVGRPPIRTTPLLDDFSEDNGSDPAPP